MKRFWLLCLCLTVFSAQTIRPRIYRSSGPDRVSRLGQSSSVVSGCVTTLCDNLIAYYPLDGNSNDSISTSNGVDTAITYATGKIGQAANGNGSTSVITLDYSVLNITGDFTISAWVKLSTLNYFFFAARLVGGGGAQNTYEFRSEPAGGLRISGGGAGAVVAGVLTTGSWLHVVGKRSGNDFTLYLDGAIVAGPTTDSTKTSLPAQPTLLGTRDDGFTHMGFELDEIGFWTRALDDSEVGLVYNSGAGRAYSAF